MDWIKPYATRFTVQERIFWYGGDLMCVGVGNVCPGCP